jgi:DNA-binding transcriptional LysR family regulator
MLTLHKLRLFMTVYDRGSFNAAAGDLLMAQSAVSQHIQSLEAALGTALFARGPRGVRPTPAGELLYDYAGRILALVAEAERSIIQLGAAQGQTLAVTATPGVNVYLLPGWLRRFQAAYPNIAVAQHTALTAEVVREVLGGGHDLGFLEGDLAELDDPALGRLRLREIEYVVTVGRDHPWAGRATIRAADLAGQPFITRAPGSRARRWWEGLLAAQGVRTHPAAELDSPGAIKYAVLDGAGVALLPDYAVNREVERGELRALRIDDLDLRRPLWLVWDKRRPLGALGRAFIGELAGDIPAAATLL